jgi:hypothetical protein
MGFPLEEALLQEPRLPAMMYGKEDFYKSF